jgi:hypothetical protein
MLDWMSPSDLSHNRIRDDGLRAIASFLAVNTTLIDLNLSNNFFRAASGRFLGAALEKNTTLQSLNLRLNRCGDEGGRLLLAGLRSNPSLHMLDISSNELGPASAIVLCELLEAQGCPLQAVNISNNVLGSAIGEYVTFAAFHFFLYPPFLVRSVGVSCEEGMCWFCAFWCRRLTIAVKECKDLITLDVRMTDLDVHDIVVIQEQMKKRKAREERSLLSTKDSTKKIWKEWKEWRRE